MDIQKEIARIETETGKFVGNCEVTPDGLKNVELLPYGPGDLILDVWNMKIRLLRAVRTEAGHSFTDVLSPADYEREGVQKWLEQALDACGGFINRSGHYPLVVPVPEWLEPEIAITALGR